MRVIASDYRSRPVVNRIRNPSLETNNTGWTTVIPGDSPGESSASRVTSGGHDGNAFMRQTWITSPGGGTIGTEIRDIAIDPTGTFLYAAQYSGSNLYKYNAVGGDSAYVGSVFTAGTMRSLAVDSIGNIWVSRTVSGATTIEKRSSTGTLLATITGASSGYGSAFGNDCNIAIDSTDHVYIAEPHADKIIKLDSSGIYILQWGSTGATDGLFQMSGFLPGIAIGPGDDVFVTGYDSGGPFRCQRFTSSGVFVSKTLLAGSGSNNKYQIQAVDSSGNLYVCDNNSTANRRILKYDQSATLLMTISPGITFPRSLGPLTLDASGNIYAYCSAIDATDRTYARILKYDSSGAFITEMLRLGGAKTITGAIPIDLSERLTTEPNARYGASVWVRSSVQQRVRLEVRYSTSSNTASMFAAITGAATVIPANTWTQLVYENWTPPNPWVALRVNVVTGTSAVVWSAGDTFDVDGAALYEYPKINTDFFDGTSTRFGWSGAADNSYSVGYPTTTP